MKLSTPRWWYRSDGAPSPITRALLTPLSWIWAAQTARRIARTTPRGADCAVICVGNLTVGGAGKTPIVRACSSCPAGRTGPRPVARLWRQAEGPGAGRSRATPPPTSATSR
jgi:hypothetical protein